MNEKILKCGYNVCSLLGDAVNGKFNINKFDFGEVKSFCDFAYAHNLTSIIYSVCESKKISPEFEELKSKGKALTFKQMKADMMCENISSELSKQGIRHIVLKGTELKKYYPKNIVRTSSDIDIYVDKTSLICSAEVIKTLGFLCEETLDSGELHFKKQPRYYVELHSDMEGFSKKQKSVLYELARNAEKAEGSRYSLNDNDFLVYSMFHLYKHFVTSGVGVRMFLDIYLINKTADIEISYVNKMLKELEIDGFAQTVEKINKVLFEGQEPSAELEEVIEFVFESGIFGRNSTNMHLAQINNSVRSMSSFDRFVINNGLSFNSMKKRYPVLKKAPFLYPFSFIHRFFYGLIYKRESIKEEQRLKSTISNERTDKYKRIFKIAKIKY